MVSTGLWTKKASFLSISIVYLCIYRNCIFKRNVALNNRFRQRSII